MDARASQQGARTWPAGAVCLETYPEEGAWELGDPEAPALLALASGEDPRARPGPVRIARDVIVEGGTQRSWTLVSVSLLTPEEVASERHTQHLTHDCNLLAGRLAHLLRAFRDDPRLARRPWVVVAAGHAAAAGLICAAALPGRMAGLVSWQGRPDLAGAALGHVRCPVLLAVDEEDTPLLDLNRRAQRRLPGRCDLLRLPRSQDREHALARAIARWLVPLSGGLGRAA
ncbi:MAG: hypothetical protein VKO21_10010 [Candidatus Sericytochromatia bacterium]|nr:hypothetical protein [Candidatus Sericytochromatia bacterium]